MKYVFNVKETIGKGENTEAWTKIQKAMCPGTWK